MFQTALGKAPKRYMSAHDKNQKTNSRQQTSRSFNSYFKFGGDNLERKLFSNVLTSLNVST